MTPTGTANLQCLNAYVQPYRHLFRDRRLFQGFQDALAGILASGTTCLRQMARVAPGSGMTPHGERRLRRLIHQQHQRSDLRADTLTDCLQVQGAQSFSGEDEVIVILDGSDLRKPHSQKLAYLDTVRDLKGHPVAGYHTLNAIGMTPNGRHHLLYHTTYSTQAPGFLSEKTIVLQALSQIVRNLRAASVGRIIFVLDRGFDDQKIFRRLRRLQVDFVVRVQHTTRRTRLTPTATEQPLQAAAQLAPISHRFEMSRPIVRDGRVRWRPTRTELRAREVWLDSGTLRMNVVHLSFPGRPKGEEHGWTLLTSLTVSSGVEAGQVVRLYLRRWSIEDVFAWTKTALGWEDVRVLDFEALRTLVALAWVAAAYVFSLSENLDEPTVLLLAHLGGYVPHKNRPPGKKVLLLGVQRLAAAYLVHQMAHDSGRYASPDTVLDSLFGRT